MSVRCQFRRLKGRTNGFAQSLNCAATDAANVTADKNRTEVYMMITH